MVKPPTPPPGPDPLQQALAHCLEVDGPDRERRLRDLSATDPELGAAVAERLASLDRALDSLLPPASAADAPRLLGEFEVRERIGGGGMGVVYAAWQPSLKREVAVKLVRPEFTWFPGARQRFEREALAVARLSHSGIVTVHAVGEQDGVPYLVMERMRGATLAEILAQVADRRPERLRGEQLGEALAERVSGPSDATRWSSSWVEACVRIVAEIADGLEHAHREGLVHRDVKPSNVMLLPDGHAKLFDFGLTSDDGDRGLTRSGAQIGTLQYMAPEQVLGNAAKVGPATDVYALGAVLYELLALRPPFESRDQRALERAIVHEEPTPLRTLNCAVPTDVETIQRVAMAPEARQRYGSAAELAADLRAVLDRRPIQARPPSRFTLARRFAQRRPALVTSLAMGLLLLTGLPSAFLIAERQSSEELRALYDREREAREAAAQRAAEAEYVAGIWIDSFDAVAPRRTNGELPSMLDVLDSGREALLLSVEERGAVRGRLSSALARVYLELDRFEDARDLADESLALIEQTAETALPDRERLRAQTLTTLASSLVSLADRDRVDGAVEQAEATTRASDPGQLCNVLTIRGRMHLSRGEPERALALFGQALDAAPAGSVHEFASSHANLGTTLVELGRFHDALGHLDTAVERLEGSTAEGEPDLLEALSNRGVAHRMLEQLDAASADYDRAAELAERLYGTTSNRSLEIRANRAGLRDAMGQTEAACDEYGQLADDFARRFSPEHPNAVICFGNHAGLLVQLGRFEEAIPVHRQLAERQRVAFSDSDPTLGFTHIRLGQCLLRTGQALPACEEFERAADVLARTERFVPDAVRALSAAARERAGAGDAEGARRAIDRGLELAEGVAGTEESVASLHASLAALDS